MTLWHQCYLPPDPIPWSSNKDVGKQAIFSDVTRTINLLESTSLPRDHLTFAFVGFRCDEGIRVSGGRPGAQEGPNAIRQQLAKLSVLKQNFSCLDVGNVSCADGDLEKSQLALSEIIALLLQEKIIPIVLGGGHEMIWGQYQGIEKIQENHHLGIMNMDAMFDKHFLQIVKAHQKKNRRFDYNCIGIQHATNVRQLFEMAKQYNAHMILAEELHHGSLEKCTDFTDRVVDENDMIYLTISLNVFAAPFAPGVSAPQILGLLPWHVVPFIRQLAASGKVISYDIADLSPRHDIDQCTAKLAANLVYEIIHHHGHS